VIGTGRERHKTSEKRTRRDGAGRAGRRRNAGVVRRGGGGGWGKDGTSVKKKGVGVVGGSMWEVLNLKRTVVFKKKIQNKSIGCDV